MNSPRFRVARIHRARVEIIPLIDVIFFLLATFVLFTLSLNRTTSLPVILPQAGKEGADEPLVLQVSEGDSLYWNRELIGLGELPGRLTAFKGVMTAAGKEPRILVSTDGHAKLGAAVRVLDEIRRAGITVFSIETSNARPTGR